MTPGPETLLLWFSEQPDPAERTPLPYCAICTRPVETSQP